MRINYFSDIHLEFGELPAPDNDADIIIAAGDIGVSSQGIEWLKSLNKPVIYVAGNHEFYKHDYKDTLKLLSHQCRDSNVHFLENSSMVLQGVRFLGCTLWTDLFIEGEATAQALSDSLNDFKKIRFAEKYFDTAEFSQLHKYSKTWLERELSLPFQGKTVVITHHAPSPWSWKDSSYALKKLAYCNDLRHLLHEYEITAWFHGHIHSRADYRIAGARVLCNPRGYYGKKLVKDFDQNRIVDI
ncbi:MAG: metallophosphoesterase [Methylococcaceae bacterium]|uniref:metallophosphoesterase n=1 Tax=Methylicorpusculum sp. TaxID=2713644 RepID=UPI002718E61B|nr:metallophosphoesterase [Methylicorpusculum sp.]MDO9163469.1 metallophosphoesterase [Methylococcaceae bacterium]MDZ4157361.1 metallophosphoesterase [Methylococcales bacterium]MDP2392650.1 metallophosphoesterase [Methylococcaceae bacterium]MDP3021151.1 metallophosphoesterase [Methylococcaceae bacterium]MDP3390164.1 metallophosphoesterase [Methylococcaceae bacterium]